MATNSRAQVTFKNSSPRTDSRRYKEQSPMIKHGSPSADSSTSWRAKDKTLSVDAKPFIPTCLSPEAAPFVPQGPKSTPASAASHRFPPKLTHSNSTPSSPSAAPEKHDYYNPYDKTSPVEFRKAIDAIYGLPFGGSLAFVSSPIKGKQTVVRSLGEGEAVIEFQVSDKITIRVASAGLSDGDYAHILINGVDYCPNQRGVNILVVDPKTFDAYVGVFDTHTHIGNESTHLTRFLGAIPENHFVLMAIRYDASRRMHPDARNALKAIGVDFPSVDDAKKLEEVVDSVDVNRGADLLSMAATVNAVECAKLLVKKGWDVNHQKRHGSRNTPLLDAVFHGSVEVVKVLLDAGCNSDLHNKWNETAKDICSKLFGFATLEEMVAQLVEKKGIRNEKMEVEGIRNEEMEVE